MYEPEAKFSLVLGGADGSEESNLKQLKSVKHLWQMPTELTKLQFMSNCRKKLKRVLNMGR